MIKQNGRTVKVNYNVPNQRECSNYQLNLNGIAQLLFTNKLITTDETKKKLKNHTYGNRSVTETKQKAHTLKAHRRHGDFKMSLPKMV